MNIRSNPDTTLPAVTTGPLPSSRKIFATPDAAPDLRVPLREIILSEGAGEPNLPVYDTSGPYNDPAPHIDRNAALPGPLSAPPNAPRLHPRPAAHPPGRGERARRAGVDVDGEGGIGIGARGVVH